MSIAKVRCAVLGLGRLGYWHAVNTASRIQNAELVSVCDIDIKKARNVATELDISSYTSSPDDIFNDDSIQAVIIAAPTSQHYNLLKKAVTANKAIFVEKPLTIDLGDARDITNMITANGVFCQVGFMRRFDPAYDTAKKRIELGDIGEPIYFRGISRDAHAPHEEFIKNSGGIYVDVSIHDFDIARYLMNAEIDSVSAHGSILKNPFMEKYQDVDQALTYVEFSSQASGDVEASRNAYYGYDIRAEIIGTEGSLFVGTLRNQDVNILTKSGNTHDILPDFPERFTDAYYIELKNFFDTLNTGGVPRVTAEDGLRALEISTAAKESLLKQERVMVKDIHDRLNVK